MELFLKMVCVVVFGVTVREILSVEISKKWQVKKKYQNVVFLRVHILLMIAQNLVIVRNN